MTLSAVAEVLPVPQNTLRSGGIRPLAPDLIKRGLDPDPLHAFGAGLSSLIYADSLDIIATLENEGATHIREIHENALSMTSHTYGVAFVLDKRAWIGFRGSNDLDDWAQNCLVAPLYHWGFRSIWSAIRQALLGWAHDVADDVDSFVLTGHSLGGAIATLATYDLARDRNAPVEALVTFAAPRVGSPFFASRFNGQSCNLKKHPHETLGNVTTRYVAYGDLVPRIPPWFFGFKHVGASCEVVWSDVRSIWALDPVTAPDPMPVHMLPGAKLPLPERISMALRYALGAVPVVPATLFLASLISARIWGSDRAENHRHLRYAGFFGEQAGFRLVAPNLPGPVLKKETSTGNKAIIGIIAVILFLSFSALAYLAVVWTGEYFWALVMPLVLMFWVKFAELSQ
ncbi:MAG: lipase family protein [Alphaproteobacteria bacterium]